MDWLERAGGRLTGAVSAAAWLLLLGVLIYGIAQLLFSADEPAQTRSGKILALLNDNWKAALIVASPIIYGSLRELINRIRTITAGGVSVSLSGESGPQNRNQDKSE